jgi:simple sugar transport system permease protein
LAGSSIAIIIGLGIGALLMLIFGYDPIMGYYWLFRGGFGGAKELMETLAFATPLMLTAITFAVGMKAGLFNIGAEGQAFLGAASAAAIGGWVTLPAGLHIAAATAFGMFFGVLWALPAAFLKLWRGVHEVISTIMLNWIARFFVMYLVVYWLAGARAEVSKPAMESARYPLLAGGTSLTAVIFVAVAFCIAIYVFLWHTRVGYELRLAGTNPEAANYAGVSVSRAMLISFIVGGLAAGLAGATQVLGRPPTWALFADLGNVMMLGFSGIAIALMGRNHPIGGIFAAIFYGGVLHGGRFMEYHVGVCSELVVAIQGIIVIALAIPEILTIIKGRESK